MRLSAQRRSGGRGFTADRRGHSRYDEADHCRDTNSGERPSRLTLSALREERQSDDCQRCRTYQRDDLDSGTLLLHGPRRPTIITRAQAANETLRTLRPCIGRQYSEEGPLDVSALDAYTDLFRPVPGIDGRDVPSLNLSAIKGEAQCVVEEASRCCLRPLRPRGR